MFDSKSRVCRGIRRAGVQPGGAGAESHRRGRICRVWSCVRIRRRGRALGSSNLVRRSAAPSAAGPIQCLTSRWPGPGPANQRLLLGPSQASASRKPSHGQGHAAPVSEPATAAWRPSPPRPRGSAGISSRTRVGPSHDWRSPVRSWPFCGPPRRTLGRCGISVARRADLGESRESDRLKTTVEWLRQRRILADAERDAQAAEATVRALAVEPLPRPLVIRDAQYPGDHPAESRPTGGPARPASSALACGTGGD